MKADRNANKVRSAQELAMAEFHEATKELQKLTREMKRMTRAHDFAGFDAQRERSNAARAHVFAAMLAVVRSDRDVQSGECASETPLNEFFGSNA
ncbi:hypothetical protein [Variovorax sp. dw_954]|uniref:hypothetical protein n=1 Tax=Variovorax sp. dw_954 TaxID=2720078 RepID=UPI001BD68DD2|nr:hypothetical protein [Variovorax sp. dw_954]